MVKCNAYTGIRLILLVLNYLSKVASSLAFFCLQRRAYQKEEEKEEDKKRMDDAMRQEVLETRVEEELEARAR